MILTALCVILTVGLGDNGAQGVSAYSVFNRGFERLMGSVDVENLVNQHVGGGMAAVMPVQQNELGAARRIAPPVARNVVRYEDDDDEDVDEPQDDVVPVARDEQPNTARKSGKKARRRDLEQRRELQRQRRAAMEIGLEDDDVVVQRLIEEQLAAENR